jgi:hypothetical protein
VKASAMAYWAAKEGSSVAEYEDAWQVIPGGGDQIEGDWASVAIADGATESLLAARWANIVTDGFATVPGVTRDAYLFAETARALAAQWPALVEAYLTDRESEGRPLRWYERPGIEKGAFATLLSLQVNVNPSYAPGNRNPDESGQAPIIGYWNSAALGDTCLFHVRAERLQAAFPMSHSAEFGTSPALLGTSDADPGLIAQRVQLSSGTVAEGDDFFLCTDALAAWFLVQVEKGGRPWAVLRDLADVTFDEWVAWARHADALRNDDVTLVHIDVW